MSTSNYRRRIRTKSPPPEITEKYLHHWDMGELYRHPERFPRMASPTLFGNDNPLELEIGPGDGEHLTALAEENPKVNFIGIDTSRKALNQAIVRAAGGTLDNILFIRADIKLMYPLLEESSLRKVYLHFPIPHHGRYRNRCIFTRRFLDVFQRALVPGGGISLITDHQPYFKRMMSIAESDARFEVEIVYDCDAGMEGVPASHFQQLWVEIGRKIFGVVLQKSVGA